MYVLPTFRYGNMIVINMHVQIFNMVVCTPLNYGKQLYFDYFI